MKVSFYRHYCTIPFFISFQLKERSQKKRKDCNVDKKNIIQYHDLNNIPCVVVVVVVIVVEVVVVVLKVVEGSCDVGKTTAGSILGTLNHKMHYNYGFKKNLKE